MLRISLVLLVASCAHQKAAHLFAPGTGDCTDPNGCEAAVDESGKFAPPDTDHPVAPENLGPGKLDTSCANVGLAVSSLTIGNYATPEERAPKVAEAKAACMRLKLDAEQRECIVSAGDATTMAYCAPQMFADVPLQLVPPEQCDDIMRDVRAQLSKPLTAALIESCKHDRWTVSFAECARASAPQYCYQVAPPLLQKKVAARVETASKR